RRRASGLTGRRDRAAEAAEDQRRRNTNRVQDTCMNGSLIKRVACASLCRQALRAPGRAESVSLKRTLVLETFHEPLSKFPRRFSREMLTRSSVGGKLLPRQPLLAVQDRSRCLPGP